MNAYIETLAPRDCGFCTLFGYPYLEGFRNIGIAFTCCSTDPEYEAPSLLGRIAHLILGLLLIFPLVNTIIFIILRIFNTSTIIEDVIEILHPPETDLEASDQRSIKLDGLNAKRNELIEILRSDVCNDRKARLDELKEIEFEAAKIMQHSDDESIEEHFEMSREKHSDLTDLDGIITIDSHMPSFVTVEIHPEKHPRATFTQVGGLTQLVPANFMCGYYALFYMRQAAEGKSLADRDAFNRMAPEWSRMIAAKRIANWLYSHRDQDIPYGLKIPTHSLKWHDMQYLIEKSESLSSLRTTSGCFMVEMDEYRADHNWPEPDSYFGLSYQQSQTKSYPTTFPIYFIVKEVDLHYYFVYAKKPWEFTVVHSLNYDVSCRLIDTYTDVIHALKGTRTHLLIEG